MGLGQYAPCLVVKTQDQIPEDPPLFPALPPTSHVTMAKALNLSSALVSSSVNEDDVSFTVCKEL